MTVYVLEEVYLLVGRPSGRSSRPFVRGKKWP